MATLQNFPMKNQRITTLSDGSPDPNAEFDCVAESIAAGLQYYLGRNFSGGVLKEIAYGRDYQGGTAAWKYVQYCAAQGVHLYPIDGNVADLLALAHGHIRAGHPVIFTEIDPYVDTSLPQYADWSHVCVWYSESPGVLVAMDPFIAANVSKSDSDWQRVLVGNEIWIMEKIAGDKPMAIGLSTPGVGKYFKQGGTGEWLCIKNGLPVHGAILNYYRMLGGAGLCGLTILGLPESAEMSAEVVGHPEITEQQFERGKVRYDPHHVVEDPPGSGTVYTCHHEAIDQTELHALQSQVIDLQHKIAQAKEVLV